MEIAIEVALAGGILVSAGFLIWGLAFRTPAALQWGLIILMLTPVARVVIMTAGLFQQRDLVFGPVSLVILAVLFSSLYTAVQISTSRRARGPEAAPLHRPSP
jgi:uncharacterized membrane protein